MPIIAPDSMRSAPSVERTPRTIDTPGANVFVAGPLAPARLRPAYWRGAEPVAVGGGSVSGSPAACAAKGLFAGTATLRSQ